MNKEIEILVPALPQTPGWVTLSQHEREWLQEHSSNAIANFRQFGLQGLRWCVELATIKQFLDKTKMNWLAWAKVAFPGSWRTAYRAVRNYENMRGTASDEQILFLAERGIAGLNNVGTAQIVNVIKKLPPPKTNEKKQLEAWSEKVGAEVRKGFSDRRKKPMRLEAEEAILVIVLNIRRVLREAAVETSAEKKAVLKKALGYAMELHAIHGSITAERTSIPDGFLPTVGRPRTKGSKKVA